MKPMDVEEAILQMNLLGHNFFVFIQLWTRRKSMSFTAAMTANTD